MHLINLRRYAHAVNCNNNHSPTTLNTMLTLALSPPLEAVQVWVPMSPEWTAVRDITLITPVDVIWKTQPLQVDVHS